MPKNAGKMFEEDFKKSVPKDCWVYRFKDGTANFNGTKNENVRFQAHNICDFQVMTDKCLYLLELKSHAGTSIPFNCIRSTQLKEMTEIEHEKIKSFFIFNFRNIGNGGTIAVEAHKVKEYIETAERKSIPFSWCEENGIKIGMQLKKVRWRYDLEKFFNEN